MSNFEDQKSRKLRSFGTTTPQATATTPSETTNSNRKPSSCTTTGGMNNPTCSNVDLRPGASPQPARSNLLWARVNQRVASTGAEARPPIFQTLVSSAGSLLWSGQAPIAVMKNNKSRSCSPKVTGWRAYLRRIWTGLTMLEGWSESTWCGRACAHVVAGGLASSHSVVCGVVVGLAVWVSCAKRLRQGGKDSWKQVAR